MAATSSDSDSDSISEEVRLQQKLLEETKNKLNKPEKRITKLVGKLSPVKKAAISSSESSDDEESNTNNKNATLHTKEIFMMQNRLKELKYQAKQLNNNSESDENKSKTPIGKLSSNKTDSDTDDSEKIANAMLAAIKLTQIKSKNSDTDSDSDSDVPTKNIATEQNSTILNSPVKTVPLRTSTPNIANKFIQAASLSTKKNVLHKILANSNNVVKKINQPENSTPTTKKPKSILKNSAQKNKPNPDDSDSDRTTLPLNQEGLKLKNEFDDSDSFSRAISSTQIINTNVQTSASDSETVVTPQIQKNDTAQKRLSFSKQLASHKSMASDKFESDNSKSKINSSNKTTRIEENKDASNKSSTQNKPNFSTQQKSEATSSSSSSSDDDSNLASNNKLNSSNNNIATMKTMLEVSAVYSASSEEEPTVTPISNSLNVKTTKPLTTTSKKVPAKKAPPKKAPPKKAPPKKPPTKKTPPKKLISSNNEISSKKITPKVSASLQENLPLRQIEISSSSSSSDEDEVDNMRIVEKIEPIKQVNISKKMPATKAVSKSLCNSKNSNSDFATQKFNTIKNVSMSEKLKIQNNLKTEQELSSDSDSDSEDEHSNNVQKMSNIQNNIPKNIEMSNSSNEFQNKNSKIFKNSTLTSEQKLTPNSAIQNNSKNAQESSSDSDSDSEEVAKSAKNVKDNTTTSEQKSLTKSTIQMNNSKNAQESTSDSDSDSEKEVAKSAKNFKTNTISEQKSSPKSTIQMNILKIAQESTSDSDSDSEEEGAKSAKNVKTNTTSDQKSTPKSTIQINNSKIAQESSSDSDSDSEKEVSKIAIISKNNTTTSEQKCSPKTTIQINNSKNTLESSSDSDSDSEEEVSKSVKISTSTTLTSNQKLLPKSINQNNNSKNALESSSDSDSDSETETKSTKHSSSREIEMQKTNNLSSQNKGNSFVYQKQLGNTEAQSILKHKNILDDMCSSSSSDNESSSSGGKKKKELPKTKITKCEKETASSVDSQGEEQKKKKLTTERMKALCDVKVVDTKSILDNQQVSGMYDSLKKYTLTNPNLKRIDAKTSLLLDDLNDDVEIWLTQCPKSLVPDLLIGQKFDFDKKSAFKMKVGSEKYTGVSQRTDKLNLCLIGSESKNNPELSIKIVKPVGTLILHQVMKAKSPIHFEKEEQFKVESPANLKVRHPIFGSNFKDKLKLDDEVEQKLLQAEIVRRKADTKAAKKKQRKSVAKSEKKKAENTNKDEIIFQLLNQTKNVINAPTEVNAKQKNKKRKISEVEPTVQSPNKLAKLDVSEVDSPTKPVAKSKKQSKTVKNVGKVKLSQPLETDSNDLLVENKVDSPTKQVAKKKKKSKTIETVTTKNVTLNKPSETKLDYSQNTLMENIIQSTMKDLEIEQLPIKHRKKKSKKDKHGDENPSIISKDEIISMNNSSPTKSKTAFIINSQSASEELENKDVHKKKKNKKHDKDKLNIVEKLPEIAHKEDENKPNKSFANSIPYMQQIVTKKRSSKAKDNNESINQSSTDANNSASKKKKKDKHKDISVTEDQLDTETKEMNDFSPEKKRKKTKDKLVEDLSINKSMDNSSKTKVKKIKNKNLEIIDKEKVIEELLNSVLKSTKIDKPSKKRKTPKDVLNIENTAEGKHKKRSKN